MLVQQHQADEARHRTDLQRIAELEGFISSVLEDYKRQEEKLRLGHFRRPNSTKAVNLDDARPAPLAIPNSVLDEIGAALDDERRKLHPLVATKS